MVAGIANRTAATQPTYRLDSILQPAAQKRKAVEAAAYTAAQRRDVTLTVSRKALQPQQLGKQLEKPGGLQPIAGGSPSRRSLHRNSAAFGTPLEFSMRQPSLMPDKHALPLHLQKQLRQVRCSEPVNPCPLV